MQQIFECYSTWCMYKSIKHNTASLLLRALHWYTHNWFTPPPQSITDREYPLSYSPVRPKVSSLKLFNGFTSISIDEANTKNCSMNSILVGMSTPSRLLCIVEAEWPSFNTSVMQLIHSNHNGTWSDDLPQLFLWTRLQSSRASSCRNCLEWDGQISNFKICGSQFGEGKSIS